MPAWGTTGQHVPLDVLWWKELNIASANSQKSASPESYKEDAKNWGNFAKVTGLILNTKEV